MADNKNHYSKMQEMKFKHVDKIKLRYFTYN